MNGETSANPLGILLKFLDDLEAINVHYDLKHVRETIMVCAYVAAGYWEIEFFENGDIEVELFPRSKGVEAVTETWLAGFVQQNKD